MTEIQFKSDMIVQLVDSMGDDSSVVRAARVSTVGANSGEGGEKLIAFLWREGHHSPFEHVTFTFMVEAPIFTINQMVRHRIASYNIESGRYKELQPVFYVPGAGRPVVQIGKTGSYDFVTDEEALESARQHIRVSSEWSWGTYESMLERGIAKEVARMVLPLNIYSSLYVTMNLRSLFNFLDLRLEHHAQYEIQEVARGFERVIREKMPVAYNAWKGV